MYRKNNISWIKHWDFEILDIICMEIAFFLAYGIRHRESIDYLRSMYIRMGLLLIIFDIMVIFFTRNYKGIMQRKAVHELIAAIEHVTTVQVLLLVYEYVIKEADEMSRAVYGLSWILSIILCYMVRLAWKQVIRKKITSDKNQRNMLLLTSKNNIQACMEQILTKEFREFKISCIAFLEDENYEDEKTNIPIVYGKNSLLEYIRGSVIDEVYVDTFGDKETLDFLVNTFLSMGVTVHIGMGFLPNNLPNQFIETIGKKHVITTTIKTASSWQIALKRFTDILGGLVGLLLMGIAFVFVAPIIKKNSPGPVFFKQERVGKNGRTFYMYKFRSMYMDAEERKKELMGKNEMNGLMFKMENDPRVIGSERGPGKGIGNFIRKTSIDELPQFWNILRGDMSLVGTRPPTLNEYKEYDLHHKIRLSMKPGLTGMWQVSGRSDISEFDEVVKLDTEYIENWSLGLDVKIILKTVKVVLAKEGSK